MSKRFITLKEAENCICNGKLYIDRNAILASAVQDYVRENNVEVIYGEEAPSVSSENKNNQNLSVSFEKEELFSTIEKILKRDFNIYDEEKIKQVTKIMKEVLK